MSILPICISHVTSLDYIADCCCLSLLFFFVLFAGDIVAILQLNSSSSSSCLCFGGSRRGGKLWSALHHGKIESGAVGRQGVTSFGSAGAVAVEVAERNIETSRAEAITNTQDSEEIMTPTEAHEQQREGTHNQTQHSRRGHHHRHGKHGRHHHGKHGRHHHGEERQRRQAGASPPSSSSGDVFLLQASSGRLAWGLVLDTTNGKPAVYESSNYFMIFMVHVLSCSQQ